MTLEVLKGVLKVAFLAFPFKNIKDTPRTNFVNNMMKNYVNKMTISLNKIILLSYY